MSRFRVIKTTGYDSLERATITSEVAVTDAAYCHHVVRSWYSNSRTAHNVLDEAQAFADAMNRNDGDYRAACAELWPPRPPREKRMLPVGLDRRPARFSGFTHTCGRLVYAGGPVGGPLAFPDVCWYCGEEIAMELR